MKSELIAVSSFRSKAQAQKARRTMDEAGIESIVRPDPALLDPDGDSRDGRWPHSDYAQLMVRPEDVEKAREALRAGPSKQWSRFPGKLLSIALILAGLFVVGWWTLPRRQPIHETAHAGDVQRSPGRPYTPQAQQ